MKLKINSRCVTSLLVLALVPALCSAQESFYVPDQLKPWVNWVKEQIPGFQCAIMKESKQCVWPGQLVLDLSDKGGRFEYTVSLDTPGEISLPSADDARPFNISVITAGKQVPAKAAFKDDVLSVRLDKGFSVVTGNFSWHPMPGKMTVPSGAALISLKVNGKEIPFPRLGESGQLWLEEEMEGQKEEQDRVKIDVFRQLSDDIPFRVTTLMVFHVSGRTRNYTPGIVTPGNSLPIQVTSPDLPYQFGPDFALTLQLKPGTHDVTIESVLPEPPAALSPVSLAAEGWPEKEIWLWNSNESFRSVEVSGGTPVDPDRANVPAEFRGKPAFALEKGHSLQFHEQRRGEMSPAPNLLNVARTLWLKLDGSSLVAKDFITGTMNQGWRVDTGEDLVLDRIEVAGIPQVITKGVKGATGVELRSQSVSVSAEGHVESRSNMKAVGWDFNAQSLHISLLLPPGWSLFGAKGSDSLSESWVTSWNLLDIFLILLTGVISAHLFGFTVGTAAVFGLILAHGEPDVPRLMWFHLLIACAILRFVNRGKAAVLYSFAKFYFFATIAVLFLVVAAFTFNQLNTAFFPHLPEGFNTTWSEMRVIFELIENSFLVWPVLLFAVWAVIPNSERGHYWRWAILGILSLGVCLFLLIATVPQYRETSATFGDNEVMDRAVMPQAVPPSPGRMKKEYALPAARSMAEAGQAVPLATREELLQVDPKAVIQTGRGLPDWNWKEISLSWNGEVPADQSMQLYLVSPALNGLIAVLRVILLLFLAMSFLTKGRRFITGAVSAVCLLLFISASPASAQSFPSREMLEDLKSRIQKEECQSYCSSLSSVKITLRGDDAVIDAKVSSQGTGSVALPGPAEQLSIAAVSIDGADTKALIRGSDGVIRVRIPDGVHNLRASGKMAPRNPVNLVFDDKPQFAEVDAPGWSVDGLTGGGLADSSIQFARTKKAEAAGNELIETVLPPWLIVQREFQVAIPWKVVTTVTRTGDTARTVIEKVPIFPGESLLTEDIRLENGEAVLSFAAGETERRWESTIQESGVIELHAPEAEKSWQSRISEEWTLRCSPIFRCDASGVKPEASTSEGEFAQQWKPFPGDNVRIEIRRPAGVEGKTLTITSVSYNVTPNERILVGNVVFSYASSRSGYLKLELPSASSLQQFTLDSARQVSSLKDGVLQVPVIPGAHKVHLQFSMPFSFGAFTSIPPISLGEASANVRIMASLPQNRWLLFCGGPAWGPVVLLWTKLLFLLIFAYLLGRKGINPPDTFGWFLLGLGLVTLPVVSIGVVVVWFVAMRYRSMHPAGGKTRFNLIQIGLVLLTLLMLGVLYEAVKTGLILSPDMTVLGNNSSGAQLNWYIDYAHASLPSPWMLTLPMWAWRVLMLLWSAWLVSALIKWFRWAYSAFTSGGAWQG